MVILNRPYMSSSTSKTVQGATLLYVSQLGSLPQSALFWEEDKTLVKLHKSVFALKLMVEPMPPDLNALQKRLADLYIKHYLKQDDRLEKGQHVRDERWRMTQAELAWPRPDDRWLSIQSVDPVTQTYHVQCTHHGVYMGLLDFYLGKQCNSKDGSMDLWVDNVKYQAWLSCPDQAPLVCAQRDHSAAAAADALLEIFGRRQSIDAKSVALPAYAPRQTPGLAWLLMDDYLVLPHPVQLHVDTKDRMVCLPQTLIDKGPERMHVRTSADVRILGLQCPLVRALQQTRTTMLACPAASLKRAAPEPLPAPLPKRAATESAYSANQLRPNRLRALASQIPYQLWLKQWTNPAGAVNQDKVEGEFIEAWCLMGQPRRSDMGETRVQLLAERAAALNNGAVPRWFRLNVSKE